MTEDLLLPRGFEAAGLHCGIKNDPAKFDLTLFASDQPCVAAGVFTQNRVCGAPVKVSRKRVPSTTTRAVVINSGNANACTGERGLDDARWMTAEVAERLDCAQEDVLVCSTGVIGHFLPKETLAAGIPALVEALAPTPQSLEAAARGMMTTDTAPKLAMQTVEIDGVTVRISGVAKGAAMIGPNMATMLCVIMTDAQLSPTDADTMLRRAVDCSFNCISVEGHTSTSDSVILMANGRAETGDLSSESLSRLQAALDQVAQELAQAIVRDAEGASHFITIAVNGLNSREDAKAIAKTVANDALVKTAIAGNDPNWGRIVSCCGRTGINLAESDITLRINDTLIYRQGAPTSYDEASIARSMADGDVKIELDFPFGNANVRFWTSDLTVEYVRLNSEYTT